jgi:hypothetical protein
MSHAAARRRAFSLWMLAMVLVIPGPVLTTVVDASTADIPFLIAFVVVQLAAATTGALVASRLPGNPIGWIFLAMGAGLALAFAASSWSEVGLGTDSGPLPGDELAAWLGSWLFIPAVFGSLLFLLLLFPTGRLLSPRWVWPARVLFGLLTLALVGLAFKPGSVGPEGEQVPNPLAAPGALGDAMELLDLATNLLAPLGFGIALTAIVLRVRRSRGVERQQLKLFTFAAAIAAAGLAGSIVTSGIAADAFFLVGMIGLASLPVAAGVAILRYRLYDIDVVINRALVYAALTATLALAYLGSVLLLQLALSPLTEDSGLAVAGSTLAVAALFRPARRRIQELVDRRFYRRRYDATRTLERFGARLRDEVALDSLSLELRTVVADTMQPAHVSLWLREGLRR